MEWPLRRFLKAFDAFQRRTLCEEWIQRKTAHIAAMFSNPNLDDEKNDRPSIIDNLERTYDQIVARIWNSDKPESQETDGEVASEWDDSFMRAGRSAASAIGPPEMPGERAIAELPE